MVRRSVPEELPGDVVWPVRVDPTGRHGPTRRQAAGDGWRRTSRGLYVPSYVEQTTRQHIVEAAAVLPAYGGVTGWAALRWLGASWFDGLRHGGRERRPVTLAVAVRSIRPQRGIDTSEERLDPSELTVHRGLAVTHARRSLFFEMRYAAGDTEAVQAAEMTAYADLVSRAELQELVSVNPGWTGVDRARTALADMDENAWSPTETTMRRLWQHQARFPRPLCNRPLFDTDGRHLGTPDLVDPATGVTGEYNGAVHLHGAQRSRDVRREAGLRAAGLEPVEMLAGDLADPLSFIARLREAYVRAHRLPRSERRWTMTLPQWWIPTFTVEQRRRLTDSQRERFLRHRLRAS